MPRKIFVSYRHEDAPEAAIAIASRLGEVFGQRNVFQDVNLAAGVNFPVALEKSLARCKVLVALIGPRWLDIRGEDGALRLSSPDDWVRMEIARALKRGITVIPVRIGGAALPKPGDLPDDIKGLLDHQAAIVSTATVAFRNDMAGLVRDINAARGVAGWKIAALAVAVLLLVFAGWLAVERVRELWPARTAVSRSGELGRISVQPGSGESFQDRPAGGQPCPMCPELLVIPANAAEDDGGRRNFMMGSDRGEANEKPPHRVTFAKPYAVAKFPVTRGEFAAFVKDTAYRIDGPCAVFTGFNWRLDPERSWLSPGFDQDDRHPVTCTNWADAKAFAAWLAQKTRLPYRLLSEAEFEYAARAGSNTQYFFGDNADQICRYANVADLTGKEKFPNWIVPKCRDGYVFTSPVDAFLPNGWGLHDMLGNVRQRVDDCWNDSYRDAPADGSAWTSGDCSYRVLRGGSWLNVPWELRSTSRDKGAVKEFRYDNYGFRVGRSIEP